MHKSVLIYIPMKYNDIRGGYLSPVLQASRYTKYKAHFILTDKNPIMEKAKDLNMPVRIVQLKGFEEIFNSPKRTSIKYLSILFKLPKHMFEIIRYIKINKIDIIHVHNLEGLIICKAVSMLMRRRIIMHVRDNANFDKRIWKIAFALSDINIVVSDSVRSSVIEKHSSVNKKKLRVVPNGALKPNNHYINDFEMHNSKYKRVGIIGAIEPRKGQFEFIEQILMKLPEDYKLYCIGGTHDIEYYKKIDDFIKKNKLQQRVIITGFQENMEDWYIKMDLIISFSTQEGMPRALLEAMSYSKPIVATDVVGNRDVILDGINGFLVSREDNERFVDAILNICTDYSLSQSLGKQGCKFFDEKYEISRSAKMIEEIYDESIN